MPGESHGQRNLVSPWGHKEIDTTKQLTLSLPIFSKIMHKYRSVISKLIASAVNIVKRKGGG